MKVVLFCGGQGLRLRDYSEKVPKPMVPIGYRPVLWHVMRWYAHYGHKDFILALGHGADVIKDYFLRYNETLTNDFVLQPADTARAGRRSDDSGGGRRVRLMTDDTSDWSITFVDTGSRANIGERLAAVRPYLGNDELFLANYADGVTDAPLPDMIEHLQHERERSNAVATFLRVRPSQTFHCIDAEEDGVVTGIRAVRECDIWINAGFFVLHQEVFDYMRPGEELVGPAFDRLAAERRLTSYRHNGFFAAMDTFKEQQALSQLHSDNEAPWEVWLPTKSHQRDKAAEALTMENAPVRNAKLQSLAI